VKMDSKGDLLFTRTHFGSLRPDTIAAIFTAAYVRFQMAEVMCR
jgi:hypothetical protein